MSRWLLWTMPSFSGRLRFVFYAGSLALFFFLDDGLDFTLSAASPHLYEAHGLTALLGIPYVTPTVMRTLMAVTYTAWAFAAIGLFTRPAKVATTLGLFLAVGFEQAYVAGSTHTKYLLLYCMVCLIFSTSDRDWSVDGWLARRRGTTSGEAGGDSVGLGATGFPRQVILLLVVSFYFSAGVSKLADGGLAWLDGVSVQTYIGSQIDRTGFPLITDLRVWVAGQLWLCQVFSVGSFFLELGAPLALLGRRIRHLFIPSWVAMHLGILLLMVPNYWIHSWCLVILLTDWEWLNGLWRGSPRSERTARTAFVRPGPGLALSMALLVPILVAPPALLIEWYPLTHVPMYATYVSDSEIGGIPFGDFGDEARVREIARTCAGNRIIGYTRRCPWRIPREFTARLALEVRGPGMDPVAYEGRIDRLRHYVVEYLASSDEAHRTVLVVRAHDLLRDEFGDGLEAYESFELSYQLEDRLLLLAAGPIQDS